MRQDFQPGQSVRCIDARHCGERLEQGRVYTVARAGGFTCDLIGVHGSYSLERFEVAGPQPAGFDLAVALAGHALKFRSGCAVKLIAYVPEAKPHCQLVLLNPATGNTVTRYANGKGSTEPYDEPGDIIVA